MTDHCECTDPSCECDGQCQRIVDCHLIRRGMEDIDGLQMCQRCADDAIGSGVFEYAQ